MMLLALLFLAGCLYLVKSWWYMKPPNYPPGPVRLPLLGHALSMPRKLAHLTMEKWRDRYGPVVGLLLGPSFKAIAVVEPNTVFEVLRREEFQSRPGKELSTSGLKSTHSLILGVLFTDGPFWVNQRRFTLRHLRDFGFGKKSMEGLILEEVNDLIEDIRDKRVQATDIFSLRLVNVLWAVLAGNRFDSKDVRLKNLLDAVNTMFRSGNPTGPFFQRILPFLAKIAPGIVGTKQETEIRENIQGFLRDVVKEHKANLDGNNPRDFIDVYLKEIDGSENEYFTEDGLSAIIFDLFSAGADTTSNTLGFAILHLALHPEVQNKLRTELDTVTGQRRKICLDDRLDLPYLEAVIAEVSRISTIAPLTAPHSTERDTQLNGYIIPKNTMVFISIYSVLHDKKHWGDPELFRPERFIDPQTGRFAQDPWMINFGLGKRVCLGESLGRSNLFLFLGRILQEFEIKLPEDTPTPSLIPVSGFTTAPQPFEAIFSSR